MSETGKPVKARRSLKLNFIYNFISQILTLVIPLITTPYLAKVLLPEGNGVYSFSASIISYFIIFSSLGFDIYGQRQIAACGDDRAGKSKIFWELFIWKSILTVLAMVVLMSVIFTVGFGKYTVIILILSIQLAATPFDIQFYYRGEENFKSLAVRSIIMRLIGLVCIFVFVKNENDTWIYALCFAGSVLISNLIMWPSALKKLQFIKFKDMRLLRHIRPCLLIFLPTLAVTVYSIFDKTMIGLLAENPDYENGCYEQSYKINSVALLLVVIISPVMTSRNASDYFAGDTDSLKRHIGSAVNYVWMTGLPLIAGFAVLSGNLTSWFLSTAYEETPLLLQIMSVRFLASGFSEVFGNQLFVAIGKEKFPTIATTIAAVINFGLNFALIPYLGATGAAIATAVCEATVTVILCIFAIKNHFITLKEIFKNCWKYVIASAIMFVAIFVLQNYALRGVYKIWSFVVLTLTGCTVYAVILTALRDKFFLSAVKNGIDFIKRKFSKKKHEEILQAEAGTSGGNEETGE